DRHAKAFIARRIDKSFSAAVQGSQRSVLHKAQADNCVAPARQLDDRGVFPTPITYQHELVVWDQPLGLHAKKAMNQLLEPLARFPGRYAEQVGPIHSVAREYRKGVFLRAWSKHLRYSRPDHRGYWIAEIGLKPLCSSRGVADNGVGTSK